MKLNAPVFANGYTQLPNDVIDEILPHLSDAGFKCYVFIIRKIKGYQKHKDRISLSQFVSGTGKSRNTVLKAVKELLDLGLVKQIKEGLKTTCYELVEGSPNRDKSGSSNSAPSSNSERANFDNNSSNSEPSDTNCSANSEHTKELNKYTKERQPVDKYSEEQKKLIHMLHMVQQIRSEPITEMDMPTECSRLTTHNLQFIADYRLNDEPPLTFLNRIEATIRHMAKACQGAV